MQVKLKSPYKYLWRLAASPEARFPSVMDSIFVGIWWGPWGPLQRGDAIGQLTWQLFGIPSRERKKFFLSFFFLCGPGNHEALRTLCQRELRRKLQHFRFGNVLFGKMAAENGRETRWLLEDTEYEFDFIFNKRNVGEPFWIWTQVMSSRLV